MSDSHQYDGHQQDGHEHQQSGHVHGHARGVSSELHPVVSRRLERDGQRYTSGRRQLVELLSHTPHPVTIPEILAVDPTLPQSSVYRNLTVLERAGVVVKVITTGEWGCYELAEDLTGHHHHLICDSCGAVRDVDVPDHLERLLDTALTTVAEEQGFVLDRHRLDLVGRCADCR